MFNPQLTVFVCVADCGSFTKAAEALFLSPTAVMKQINALEKHLNLKLLLRSAHGVHLTPAGEVIYRDARFLFDYSRRSIEQARQAMDDADRMFCVGTSLLNPAKPFMDLWYRVNRAFPITNFTWFLLKTITKASSPRLHSLVKNSIFWLESATRDSGWKNAVFSSLAATKRCVPCPESIPWPANRIWISLTFTERRL